LGYTSKCSKKEGYYYYFKRIEKRGSYTNSHISDYAELFINAMNVLKAFGYTEGGMAGAIETMEASGTLAEAREYQKNIKKERRISGIVSDSNESPFAKTERKSIESLNKASNNTEYDK